jgi:hypothetical protein
MKEFIKNKEQSIKWIALVLWCCMSIYTLSQHEIWRDEMRALSIVIENSNTWHLIAELKNEGHPVLWYLILKVAYFIFPNTLVLKIVSWLIGLGTVILLFRYSKLPFLLVISYAFGQILLWENTIMCRNYGISSLLMLIFLAFYRKSNLFGILITLFLLIQTNALSLVASWLLLILVIYEMKLNSTNKKWQLLVALSLLFISTWIFYYTTSPDQTSIVGNVNNSKSSELLLAACKSLIFPNLAFKSIVGDSAIMNIILAISLSLCFIYRRMYLILFWIMVGVTNFVNTEIYNLFTRHLGVLLTFFIVLLDIGNVYNIDSKNSVLSKLNSYSKFIVIPVFFIALNVSAILNSIKDIRLPISSNKELAQYIKSHNRYSKSTIIADADYMIEGLPYYLDNPIYIIREQKFGRFIHFTRKNKNELSTHELLMKGAAFTVKTGCPTLFICNQKFNPQGDTLYHYPCYTQEKFLKYTLEDLVRIKKIKEFYKSYEDENYTLYELVEN